MKIFRTIYICLVVVLLAACGGSEQDTARQAPIQSQPVSNTPPPAVTPEPATTPPVEPPQNAAGVWHYICPNGHAGGGGGATACPECGTTLEHNTAYHGNAADTDTPTPAADATAATTPPTPIDPAATPPAEPAQNAAGVWHYICPNGHAGGGGGATACPECGTTLEHNTAYHGGAAGTNPATPLGTNAAQVVGGTPPSMFADPTKQPVNATIGTQVAPTAAPTLAEPAQNAAGVWHYTCPSGCAGGGGSATACTKCGTTLAHNQAYH